MKATRTIKIIAAILAIVLTAAVYGSAISYALETNNLALMVVILTALYIPLIVLMFDPIGHARHNGVLSTIKMIAFNLLMTFAVVIFAALIALATLALVILFEHIAQILT